jgi:ABC-type Fe3+/spermidine/putrescine transport system ATPase subunit
VTLLSRESSEDVLLARGLCLDYGEQRVLRDVNVSFGPMQTVAITGPSGSGKTSLLYTLSGLERPSKGSVTTSHPIWCPS